MQINDFFNLLIAKTNLQCNAMQCSPLITSKSKNWQIYWIGLMYISFMHLTLLKTYFFRLAHGTHVPIYSQHWNKKKGFQQKLFCVILLLISKRKSCFRENYFNEPSQHLALPTTDPCNRPFWRYFNINIQAEKKSHWQS